MGEIEINLQQGFDKYLAIPNAELLFFALAICAIYSFKEWKMLLLSSAFFFGGLILGIVTSMSKIFSVSLQDSILMAAVISLLAAAINLTKKGPVGFKKFRYLLSVLIGLAYTLNQSLLKPNFFQTRSVWSDTPLIVLKIFAGFLLALFVIQFVSWLFLTAFSIAKRDWTLVISGSVIGMSALTIISILG